MATGTRDADVEAAAYLKLIDGQVSATTVVFAPQADAGPEHSHRPAGARLGLDMPTDLFRFAGTRAALAHCLDVMAALLTPSSAMLFSPWTAFGGDTPQSRFARTQSGGHVRMASPITAEDPDMGVLRSGLEAQALLSASHGQIMHTMNRYGAAMWLPLVLQPRMTLVLCLRRHRSAPFTALERELGQFVAGLLSQVLQTAALNLQDQEMMAELQHLIDARLQAFGGLVSAIAFDAERLAYQLSIQAPLRDEVRLAAILHDIGMVEMPALKPRRSDLSMDRRHANLGADRVRAVPALRGTAPLIKHHHEWWDGTGYPDGLAGCAIPLGSRIIAVVDAFHARTLADLPACNTGNGPGPEHRAVVALVDLQQQAGSRFDPYVVDAFVALVCDDLGIAPGRLLTHTDVDSTHVQKHA
jgi:hypothetical protein